MTRQVLLAGLLGGLLGGVGAFAAGRLIKPPEPIKTDPIPAEARAVARQFVAKLRAGRIEEFAQEARSGFRKEEAFKAFKANLINSRSEIAAELGPPTGEFEVLQESIAGESIVRLVYLEKFDRGGVVWVLVLYRDAASAWRLTNVDYGGNLLGVFAGLS